MTTITRERLQEVIDGDILFTDEQRELARIALASLTAEPVLYAAEETLAYANMGELHLTCLSEPMGDAVIPLYAAQPAPVVNAEYGDAYQGAREDLSIWKSRALEAEDRVRELEQINDHLVKEEQGESRMGESVIRESAPVVPEKMSYQDGVVFVLNNGMSSIERGTVARRAWNACRAAMLQGKAEPVSNRDELPVIGWLRSDYNNDDKRDPKAPLFMLGRNDPSETWGVKYIPLTGNSPVIPGGYVVVPVEPTMAMLDEFDSIIDYGAEDSKDAWCRLIAAAPQQGVK